MAAAAAARAAAPSRVVRYRLAAVVATLALATFDDAPGAFAAGSRGKEPRLTIGARVVSGTPQSAHAYVSPGAPTYVTEFPKALVVHLVGKHINAHRVRFTCAQKQCALGVPVEPAGGKVMNTATYEVEAVHDQAALKITLTTNRPGTFAVYAAPVGDGDEIIKKSAPFVLVAR
ncbi:MAG: hypothetical protein JWN27_977 [Candidatus Eremiobacteraeota bacterium]|nr:hypothetical protein [Candidatus Eremiobacteraeota bacterium]